MSGNPDENAPHKSEDDHLGETRQRVLDAAAPHLAFDGFSEASLRRAIAESGVDNGLAALAFPRGGVDLAVAYHARSDDAVRAAVQGGALDGLKMREKIAACVWALIEAASRDPEATRRAAALWAQPIHAAEGARLIWDSADLIWRLLGDASTDYNWHTKRATLSGVIASVMLYWMSDRSEGWADTRAFLDRRINDVMQIEKAKAALRANPAAKLLLAGPRFALSFLKAPRTAGEGFPGRRG